MHLPFKTPVIHPAQLAKHKHELKMLDISSLKYRLSNLAIFPHSPILHNACASMCVVLCFATKKQQKHRIVS